MNEEQRNERRLQREAREVYLGRIVVDGVTNEQVANRDAQVAQVEVTYQLSEAEPERAGFFRVYMPYDADPWETAYDAVDQEAARRWPEAEYRNIDDIFPA